jgi:hypothetical protein
MTGLAVDADTVVLQADPIPHWGTATTLVGVAGFEPTASSSRTTATREDG